MIAINSPRGPKASNKQPSENATSLSTKKPAKKSRKRPAEEDVPVKEEPLDVQVPKPKKKKTKQLKSEAPPEKVEKIKIKNEGDDDKPPTTISYKGETIAIGYIDGHPVKKEDAQRFYMLRKKLIASSLPINKSKLAKLLEKAKATEKPTKLKNKAAKLENNTGPQKNKAVKPDMKCYKCSKAGHRANTCPELGNDSKPFTGVFCFKCGSTEHKTFECKVVEGHVYKYATCYICKKAGHLLKQCPENPEGIYKNGGACDSCGDVRHLTKDCDGRYLNKSQDNVEKEDSSEDEEEPSSEDESSDS